MSHDLQDDLHVAERELATAQEKERQLNLKIKSISGKLRAEQDEVCVSFSLCVASSRVGCEDRTHLHRFADSKPASITRRLSTAMR